MGVRIGNGGSVPHHPQARLKAYKEKQAKDVEEKAKKINV